MKAYNLRLVSGRVVEPPRGGGFQWYWRSGERAGLIGSITNAAFELARQEVGGIAVTRQYGNPDTMIEFIPIAQIESVIAIID